MTRTTLYGTLTQDEELNENEKAMLYIKECAELVGLEVIEDKTAFSINFIAKIMKRLRKEPKTGHWIEVAKYSDGKHEIKCSECRSHIIDRGHANSCVVKEKYKYCPRCGARMIESQESEETDALSN